jgi:hypothetical protein
MSEQNQNNDFMFTGNVADYVEAQNLPAGTYDLRVAKAAPRCITVQNQPRWVWELELKSDDPKHIDYWPVKGTIWLPNAATDGDKYNMSLGKFKAAMECFGVIQQNGEAIAPSMFLGQTGRVTIAPTKNDERFIEVTKWLKPGSNTVTSTASADKDPFAKG